MFLDTTTGEFIWEDPRLQNLPIDRNGLQGGTEEAARKLRELVTPETLKKRGVPLRDFLLV
jgi:hypothetical protein